MTREKKIYIHIYKNYDGIHRQQQIERYEYSRWEQQRQKAFAHYHEWVVVGRLPLQVWMAEKPVHTPNPENMILIYLNYNSFFSLSAHLALLLHFKLQSTNGEGYFTDHSHTAGAMAVSETCLCVCAHIDRPIIRSI